MNAHRRYNHSRRQQPWAELVWIAKQHFNLFKIQLRQDKSFFGRNELDRHNEEGYQFTDSSRHLPTNFLICWISKQHFEIWRLPCKQSIAFIKVLGQNGVNVNGIRVEMNQSRLLRNFDTISIAGFKLFQLFYTTPNVNPSDYPGLLTERFVIGNVIKTGGQGSIQTIYEVKTVDVHENFGFKDFKYAMKVVKNEGNPNMEYLKCEIEYLNLLQGHPNIVELVEIYRSPKFIFLVMEFCDMDLQRFIVHMYENRKNAKFEVDQETFKIIFYQICSAVSHMHSKGIAHRDIKCENILLRKSKISGCDDDFWIVKLADFGFSKAVENKLSSQLGTEMYMPPEIMDLKAEYDLSVDIWSLGCVLFALLTGKYPFHRNYHCNGTLQDQICNGTINWVSTCLVSHYFSYRISYPNCYYVIALRCQLMQNFWSK